MQNNISSSMTPRQVDQTQVHQNDRSPLVKLRDIVVGVVHSMPMMIGIGVEKSVACRQEQEDSLIAALRENEIDGGDTSVAFNILQKMAEAYFSNERFGDALNSNLDAVELIQNAGGRGKAGEALLNGLANSASASFTQQAQLGDLPKARAQYNNVLALLDSEMEAVDSHSKPHADSLKSKLMNDFSLVLSGAGKLDEARELLEQSLALQQAQGRATFSAETAVTSLSNLANICIQSETPDLNNAAIYLSAAKQVNGGENAPEISSVQHSLGNQYANSGFTEEAKPLLEEAYAHAKSELGEDHPTTLARAGSLGTVYVNTGELDSAKPLFEASVKGNKDPGPERAAALSNLGVLNLKQGNLNQASTALTESLALTEKHYGSAHMETATQAKTLAAVHFIHSDLGDGNFNVDDLKQAETLANKALDIYNLAPGENRELIERISGSLGRIHDRLDGLSATG